MQKSNIQNKDTFRKLENFSEVVELCPPEATVKRATKTDNLFCETAANELKSDVLRSTNHESNLSCNNAGCGCMPSSDWIKLLGSDAIRGSIVTFALGR